MQGKAIEKGKRVVHKQYSEKGTITEFGEDVTIQMDNGRPLKVKKIIMWEIFAPLDEEQSDEGEGAEGAVEGRS
jgi:hypothetical protein